jgi:hypothetical protein
MQATQGGRRSAYKHIHIYLFIFILLFEGGAASKPGGVWGAGASQNKAGGLGGGSPKASQRKLVVLLVMQ